MAFTDKQLMFCESQAIDDTAQVVSENVIDLWLNNLVTGTGRNIGVGDPLEIFVRAENRATMDGTLVVRLYTHTTTAVMSGTILWTIPAAVTLTTTNGAFYNIVVFRVPLGNMKQYIGLGLTHSTDSGSNLLITAGMVSIMTQARSYESGLNFA